MVFELRRACQLQLLGVAPRGLSEQPLRPDIGRHLATVTVIVIVIVIAVIVTI